MRIQSKLCHIDAERSVVLVSGWDGKILIGSALGEADNAELAEDRAIERLRRRLQTQESQNRDDIASKQISQKEIYQDNKKIMPTIKKEIKNNETIPLTPERSPISEMISEPEDWSEELAAVDLELKRIGWSRNDEQTYLMRAFNIRGRNRLTKYNVLKEFLSHLKGFRPNEKAETIDMPISREKLMTYSNELLDKLGWTKENGSKYLEQCMNKKSRTLLTNHELMKFNLLLEDKISEEK